MRRNVKNIRKKTHTIVSEIFFFFCVLLLNRLNLSGGSWAKREKWNENVCIHHHHQQSDNKNVLHVRSSFRLLHEKNVTEIFSILHKELSQFTHFWKKSFKVSILFLFLAPGLCVCIATKSIWCEWWLLEF